MALGFSGRGERRTRPQCCIWLFQTHDTTVRPILWYKPGHMEAEGCRRDRTHLWLVRICILAFQPTFLRYVCKWCSMFGSGDQPSTVTSHCTVVQDRLFQRRLFSARVFTPNIKLRHQDPCPQKAGLIPYASHLLPFYALLKLYWGSGGCWSQSCLADVRCRRKRCSGLVQWPDASLLVKENRVEEKHHVWVFFFWVCWNLLISQIHCQGW